MNELFKKYTERFTVGELAPLPKTVNPVSVHMSADRYEELGYVKIDGTWVPTSEAVLLPQGGRLVWVRL